MTLHVVGCPDREEGQAEENLGSVARPALEGEDHEEAEVVEVVAGVWEDGAGREHHSHLRLRS